MSFKGFLNRIENKVSVVNEAFFKYVTVKGFEPIAVYRDPTTNDIDEIKKEVDYVGIRYGVNIVQRLYAWNANVSHNDMEKALGMKFDFKITYDDFDNSMEEYDSLSHEGLSKDIPIKVIERLKVLHPTAKNFPKEKELISTESKKEKIIKQINEFVCNHRIVRLLK